MRFGWAVVNATISVLIAYLLLCAGNTAAQSDKPDKEIAVVEVGAATSISQKKTAFTSFLRPNHRLVEGLRR